jgi:sulfite reductase (ferredoxin)
MVDEKFNALISSTDPDKDLLKELIDRIKQLFDSLDSSLEFKVEKKESSTEDDNAELKTNVEIDLRGVGCPMNYVKTKLEIEKMQVGEIISVLLDDGEPINNVPASLKEDGQELLNMEKIEEYYKITVKKNN